MDKKRHELDPAITFREQTPGMLIGRPEADPLYQEAFLSREESGRSEFCRNTTTWD